MKNPAQGYGTDVTACAHDLVMLTAAFPEGASMLRCLDCDVMWPLQQAPLAVLRPLAVELNGIVRRRSAAAS